VAYVEIQLNRSVLTEDLLRFLRSLGYEAEECGYALVRVDVGELDDPRLDLHLRLWEAARPAEEAAVQVHVVARSPKEAR
jgi:hypothetical protein